MTLMPFRGLVYVGRIRVAARTEGILRYVFQPN